MRQFRVLTAFVVLTCATATAAAAQTVTISGDSGPRTGARIGYGGHGSDWDASIDSALLANAFRIRGSVGGGLWDSDFDDYPDPRVIRLAASGLFFIPTRYAMKPYVGVGVAALLPRGFDYLRNHRGTRLIGGIEGSGERWTVGVEGEVDIPRGKDIPHPLFDTDLMPAGRIGISLRRSF